MKVTRLSVGVRVVEVVHGPKYLGAFCTMWSIDLEVMLVDLLPMHKNDESLSVHASFCMTVSSHVPGIAPSYIVDDALPQIVTYRHNMSEQSLFRWCL